ncbi:protocadherin gamma-B4-like [Hyperolius riggenbachi]|uniref:protocadherin gamma-B4-like n=1 Tax=Hyperolius riggenbachi TaxID=752182 RepID=UPI0035A3B3E9
MVCLLDMKDNARCSQKHWVIAWQVFFYCNLFFFSLVCCQLQYSIPEELREGSVVGNVAKDLGLDAKELALRKFQIVSQAKKQYFSVQFQNGNLLVSDRIDRETLCGSKQSCFLNLEAVMENPLNFYTITIDIQDINDNSPIFSTSHFDIEVSELTSPGARFALGNAIDPDLGTNAVAHYSLNDVTFFSLGERNTKDGIWYPELVLENSLDREKQSFYELVLSASDGGRPPKTGTALIKITVQDVNDNFPVFSKDTYQISLKENVPVGFLVVHLNATDMDEGSNAFITYAFSHMSKNELFSIDPLNGDIKVTGDLDYEAAESYEITVEAKDGGGHVGRCKISIQVIDVNDNVPEIMVTSLSTTIQEDSPVGTVIALINVRDLDSGINGEVVCQISNTLPFQLIPSSSSYYKLVSAAMIDREQNSEYNITIYCSDNGSPQLCSNKTIQLAVSDVNDNPPVFDKNMYTVYIVENNQPGTSVHKVHAIDLDHEDNGKVTYSILQSYIEEIPVSSYVSMNSITGVLYAQRSFDFEQLREFHFQVMAKDSGSPSQSSNVTVRICIIDKNDNFPKILYPSPETTESGLLEFIPHSAEKGYLVTKVIAVDADSGHNAWLSYHLLQILDSSLFIIGQHTGEIRLGRDLPDVDPLRQKLVVMVKDNGVPSLSSTVTVSLVVAENFQQVVPEIKRQPNHSETSTNATFYLVIAIALISLLFIVTVIIIVIFKCRKMTSPTNIRTLGRDVYPQFTLGCPSEISDTSLPFPFSYDVCVTLDSKQNEIAYLKPVQNVPTENLIDTGDSEVASDHIQKFQIIPVSATVASYKEFATEYMMILDTNSQSAELHEETEDGILAISVAIGNLSLEKDSSKTILHLNFHTSS